MSGPWAPLKLNEWERLDFWEVCEDRYQTRSTILTSHQPVARSQSRSATRRWPTGSSTAWSTTPTVSKGGLNEEESMPYNRRGGARGPLLSGEREVSRSPCTPFSRVWPPASASLRIVSRDEVEHFSDKQKASVAKMVFAYRLPLGICVRLRRNPHPGNRPGPRSSCGAIPGF